MRVQLDTVTKRVRVDQAHRAYLLHYMHRYCRGMERARTGASLAKALTALARESGLDLRYDERKVREIIQSVRRERDPRHVIGSSTEPPFGYFVCQTLDEAERCAQQYWSRVREQAETARDFETAAFLAFGLPPITEDGQVTFRFGKEAS